MQQSPEKLKTWLEAHKDQVLKIQKEEDDDLDQATIKLQEVEYAEHHDTDDYLAVQALLLKGEGTVLAGEGEAKLPAGIYEIALTDQWFSASDDKSLHLSTERGSYRIEVEQQ